MIARNGFHRCLAACSLLAALLACNLSRYTNVGQGGTPAPAGQPSVEVTLGSTAAPAPTPNPTLAVPAQPGAPDSGSVGVAYVKDNALWWWSGGSTRKLTNQGPAFQPRISPDGAWVAFLRPADDFHIELWAIKTDGTQEQRLVSIADLDTIGGGVRDSSAVAIIPAQFDWLPGGSLAFNTQQIFNGPGGSRLEDLHLVSPDGAGVQHLFLPAAESAWGGAFAFSPDGEQVALSKTDAILLARADGANYRPALSYDFVLTYSEYHYYARPSWSPDGNFLRVAVPPADPLASPTQPTALWKIPLEGSPQQEGSVLAVPFFDAPVAYSPDLSHIAYLTQSGAADSPRDLNLAAYDGQGSRAFASGPLLRFAGWSPDSQRVAYVAGEMQELWLGAIDGMPQPYPGLFYGAGELRWVDSARFVVVLQRSDSFSLLLADLSGSRLELDSFTGVPPEFDVR